jgi:hypothetical protein
MPKASIQDAPAGLCSRQQEPDHGKNKAVQQPNRATNKADSKKKVKNPGRRTDGMDFIGLQVAKL